MKTNKKHFELFKSECQKWIEILKLDGWTIYFNHGKANKDAFATVNYNLVGRVATVFMSDNWDETGLENMNESIKRVAKHEMLHVLLARMGGNASYRYATEDELTESEEELVRKLEKIIK